VKRPSLTFRQWVGWIGFGLVFLFSAAVAVWHGDILRAGLDPQVPFQTYRPPRPPDYARRDAWALSEAHAPGAGPAHVFFLHPTTYDGGSGWNAAIDDRRAAGYLARIAIPNYAAPFAQAGTVSAPRYRQASLYTRLTLREDAREARMFAYRDAAAAFDTWLSRHPNGPLILVGVEQGGELMDRLLRDRIAADPRLSERVAAAYLIETLTPAEPTTSGLPPCARRAQASCVVAYASVVDGDSAAAHRLLRRALTWDEGGRLEGFEDQRSVCVNPITGARSGGRAVARRHLGGANATGLEWGVRPALISRAVSAECRDGLLWYSRPASESFRERGGWSDRRKVKGYNLFYGDLEADALARLGAWRRAHAR